jgi:hypothetical protein
MQERAMTYLGRRGFLKAAGAAAGAASLGTGRADVPSSDTPPNLIDVNVNLGHWPLRRLGDDEPPALVAKLQSHGVVQAWAGSLDAMLHKDLAAVNERLVAECRQHGPKLLVPFGSVNPKLPDWEEELRRCKDVHHMPGIRLHPNYHGYKLDDPDFVRLLRLATQLGLLVQLAVIMEDRRMMHPLLQVEPTDLKPLSVVLKENISGLRLVLLNSSGVLRSSSLVDLVAVGQVCVEIAMLEGVGGVGNLLQQVPLDRVLFGSFAPVFYFESALFKLKESPLSERELAAIRHENARRLLTKNPESNDP